MSDIQTWLENLPDRGDETLVGVPPSALAELLDERDKLRKEHRAMSKGAQTNAEIAKRQAEKIAELREQLRVVTAERDALREERDQLRRKYKPDEPNQWEWLTEREVFDIFDPSFSTAASRHRNVNRLLNAKYGNPQAAIDAAKEVDSGG